MRTIREALGAIAIGEPAAYRLTADARGEWHVRRDGDSDERRFATKEEALRFARLAVARCASYCLRIKHKDGGIVKEFFNWPPPPDQCRA